jgi:hypothetical protein
MFFYLRHLSARKRQRLLRLPFREPAKRRLWLVAAASSQQHQHAAVGELLAAACSSQL